MWESSQHSPQGVVFVRFPKNMLSGNAFSVLQCLYFIYRTSNEAFSFFYIQAWQPPICHVLLYYVMLFCSYSNVDVMSHQVHGCVCMWCCLAHVYVCMPPWSPLIYPGPLAGNLSIEIRKKNTREECLWLSQWGIYNGLQAALTARSLFFSFSTNYSRPLHTYTHTKY